MIVCMYQPAKDLTQEGGLTLEGGRFNRSDCTSLLEGDLTQEGGLTLEGDFTQVIVPAGYSET